MYFTASERFSGADPGLRGTIRKLDDLLHGASRADLLDPAAYASALGVSVAQTMSIFSRGAASEIGWFDVEMFIQCHRDGQLNAAGAESCSRCDHPLSADGDAVRRFRLTAEADSESIEARQNELEQSRDRERLADAMNRSPWGTGSFYLAAVGLLVALPLGSTVVLVVLKVPWYWAVIGGGAFLVIATGGLVYVGSLQLRHDARISEHGMLATLRIGLRTLTLGLRTFPGKGPGTGSKSD